MDETQTPQPETLAPEAPVADYNQPTAPAAKQPPEGYSGPWPSIYKDANGNPVNAYAPGVTLVDAGDPTAW
jgi:hypothetical protein